MAPHRPSPAAVAGSRMTAARVTWGAISLSSSSHLPLMPYSKIVKPVALPPGRARLSTKPAPTGSGVPVNTIGMVRVACSSDGTTAPPEARMTSGASATNSDACLRKSSASPAPQRYSIRTLRPTVQPNSCRPCRNAALRACPSASSEPRFMSTPTRRTRSACCARAASGHTAAAAPRSEMKSRRFNRWNGI